MQSSTTTSASKGMAATLLKAIGLGLVVGLAIYLFWVAGHLLVLTILG